MVRMPLGASTTDIIDALALRLANADGKSLSIAGFRRAAVLVPVLEAEAGAELLFTVRAADLARHAGEIAFPGGRLEPGETVLEAALRETYEEIGLRVRPEDVLGALDDHPSPAGYVATPLVARVPWPQPVKVDPGEVAEVFTVPLAELIATEPETEVRTLEHYRRRLYAYTCRGRRIWGFTGNVVRDLLRVLERTDMQDDVRGVPPDPFEVDA